MAVGDDDMADALAGDRRQKRRHMGLVRGARVDDRDLALADDVAARSGERERRGVAGDEPARSAAKAASKRRSAPRRRSRAAADRWRIRSRHAPFADRQTAGLFGAAALSIPASAGRTRTRPRRTAGLATRRESHERTHERDFGLDAVARRAPPRASPAPRCWRSGERCVLAASAKAQVPFYPVPMTLQTLAVLAIGAAYGARLAAATLALYLAEGLFGLPVFAGALAGPGYMAGPTAGYLVGFLVAAALVGWLAERGWDRAWPRLIGAMAIGHVVIFAFGFAWLALPLGAEKAWEVGRRAVLRGDAGQDPARRGADRRGLGRPRALARERRLSDPERPGAAARAGAAARPRDFRPFRAAHHALERQRSLRPSQQRRLLRVLRRGGERDPHRGGTARSRFEPGRSDWSRRAIAAFFPASPSPTRSSRRRGGASRPLVRALSPGGVQGRRAAAPARKGDTPMSMSTARPASRRRSPTRTVG